MTDVTATSKTDVKFKELTVVTAATLKGGMKVGAEGVIELSADLYETTLPEGKTMAELKEYHDHRDMIVAAASLAAGELSVDYFKANKDAQQVSVSLPIYKDNLNVVVQRSKDLPASTYLPEGKTVYGSLRANYTANGAVNRGELKKVKTHLSALAEAALKA